MDVFLENIGSASEGYILLTQPTKFRKKNNILMGATNGTLLHYSWAAQVSLSLAPWLFFSFAWANPLMLLANPMTSKPWLTHFCLTHSNPL